MADKETVEYLRIDEKKNAVDSLNRAVGFLKNTKDDPYNWKWFIIAIHHATHCFMLAALQNTDLSGIWEGRIIRDADGLIEISNPKNRLISFKKAFEWIQDPGRMQGYVNSKPFESSQCHKESIECLNDQLRNKFIHYIPGGWSIHSQYFLDIIKPVLEIIEFIVFEGGRVCFEEQQESQIKEDLNQIRDLIDSSDSL